MSIQASLTIAALLLLGNAFFVGAEFALISARRSSVELLARGGSRTAAVVLHAMERLSLMLAGAQLGITLCSLGLGAVGEPLIAHLLEGPFQYIDMPEYLLHPVSLAIALSVMTYLHVVVGEMIPKNVALAEPTRAARLLVPPMVVIVRILRPFVVSLNYIANTILRLFGVDPKGELASTFSSDEVAGFVEESRREGLISEDEGLLLSGALRFDVQSVKKVVIPTDKMAMLTSRATPEHIEQLAAETGYSRFPVSNDSGRLLGYIHLKDVLAKEGSDRSKAVSAKELRPLVIVKSSSSLREALTVMQRSGSHLAQVVNSHGRVLGIVALENVLEELVGEIRDETQKQRAIRPI
jgi:CBS domain containing-hemolysin-like protein